MNLMEGLFEEMNRCRELHKEYKHICLPGAFGAAMIARAIELGEESIKENDVVKMIEAYSQLKEMQ